MPQEQNDDKAAKLQAELDGSRKTEKELKDELDVARGQLQALVQDSEIAQVLEARKEGRKLSIQDVKKKEKEEPAPDFEEMSAKEIAEWQTKQILNSLNDRVEEALKPLNNEIKALKGAEQGRTKASIQKEVDEAKKKYSDFVDLEAEMVEIAKTNPGLSIEELYWTSKMRSGSSLGTQPAESERPTSLTLTGIKMDGVDAPKGRKGMKQILSKALSEE